MTNPSSSTHRHWGYGCSFEMSILTWQEDYAILELEGGNLELIQRLDGEPFGGARDQSRLIVLI